MAFESLQREWPDAEWVESRRDVQELLQVIFRPQQQDNKKPLQAYVKGTKFQLQVWQALIRVPYGKVISYGSLAEDVSRPRAARAVGSAVGANQLAYLIPCHRVIRETGAIGNYRWGIGRKHLMLACEQNNVINHF